MATKTTQQTTKLVLRSTQSVTLDGYDASNFYDASLVGNSLSGYAHGILKNINSTLTGDSLTAVSNGTTLYGGAGKDSLKALAEGNVLVAGKGTGQTLAASSKGTSFVFGTPSLVPEDRVIGGAGTDTLVLSKAAANTLLGGSFYSGLTSTEVLSLTGANSVTLDASASSAGINRVIGGDAASSYLLTADYGSATIAGGAAKDVLSVANRAQLVASSLSGGAGADTLVVRGSSTLSDADFSRVQGIEAVSLAAASTVTLGSTAKTAGVSLLAAGNGAVGISQDAGFDAAVLLRGSSLADTFVVAKAGLLSSDTIAGGAGDDAIDIQSASSIGDDTFKGVSAVEILSLAGGSDITLAAAAAKAGIVTVYGGSSSTTLTQDAKSSAKLVVVSGSGNDLTAIGTAKQAGLDSLAGGAGTDTLALLSGGSVSDASFANVSGYEVLSLTGATALTLAGSSSTAGFQTILGGDGLTRVFHTSENGRSLTVAGGAGTSFVSVADAQVLLRDSLIAGSGGTGTLAVASEATLGDAEFAQADNFGVLSLTGATALTLGAGSDTAGITTVLGGAGDSTFTKTTDTGVQVTAGKGNDLFVVNAASYLGTATFAGGGGSNTLFVADDGEQGIDDGLFANHKGLQVLSLAGNSSVTVGESAGLAGISQIYGSEGGGSLAVTQDETSTSALTIIGGGGNDLVSVATAAQLGKNSIDGGSGSNTLVVSAEATLADKAFGKVQDVQALSLTGSSSVVLGTAAVASGITTLYAGDGASTIGKTAEGDLVIEGGEGTASISLKVADYLSTTTVRGGAGGDNTLAIGGAGAFEDDAFSVLSNVQVLSLTGASSAVFDSVASAAGIATVFGGAGAGSISLLSGTRTFVGAKGNDLISVSDAALLLADNSIVGGGGKDTLQILGEGEVGDDAFANVQGTGFLTLNGASAVTLDAGALAVGIATVAAGDGNTTLVHGEGYEKGLLLKGNAGDDLISIANVDLLLKDVISGGDGGGDVLAVATGGELTNAALAKVSGIEILSLSGDSSVTLGANAGKAGVSTIVGGEGSTTVIHAAAAAKAFYVDGTGSASNLFGVANQGLLNDDTFAGGEGEDTLWVTGAGKVDTGAFGNVTGVEVLSLTGASSTTLGDEVVAAGITTVLGGSGNGVYSLLAGGLNVVAQGGNDRFVVADAALLEDLVLEGGEGVNTLGVAEGAIADEAFANLKGVQALSLSGASEVTLGGTAAETGVTLVAAGAGDTTLTQTADNANATRIVGNDGNDLIVLGSAEILGADTILGGKGVNTLAIGGDVELGDEAFANLKQIGLLSIEGATVLTLGSAARSAGISTVLGGADSDGAYVQTAGVISLVAGSGNDLVSVLSNKMLAADTLAGGDGDNTLHVAAAAKLADKDFANATGFGALSLTGASSVELGEAAGATGIASIFGGEGSTTITQVEGNTAEIFVDLSAGSANRISFATAEQVAAANFVGSGGDTLAITGASTIESGILDNISGVSALSLSGASSAALEVVAAAGITLLAGGNDAGTYSQADAAEGLYLKAGRSADSIAITDIAFLAGETLDGGLGNDTLTIDQDGIEIADEAFTNLVSIDSVVLTGSAQVTLDAAAKAAGVGLVSLAGDADSSFTQLEGATQALTLVSGAGNDLYSINDGLQLTKDSLSSGEGSDTLQVVAEGVKIADRNFARINGFEVLSLSAGSSVELGASATEGLAAENGATVVAGGSGATVNAAKYENALVIDASANADGGSYYALGAAAGTILLPNADAFASTTIVGGAEVDTLSITGTDAYEFSDEAFDNKRGLDVLVIGDVYTEREDYAPNEADVAITLAGNASDSGITTIIGGLGNFSLSQTVDNAKALYVDGSTAATNFMSAAVATIAANDTFIGNADAEDTLAIGYENDDANPTNEIADGTFENKTSFEFLQLTGDSALSLGGSAVAAGITNVKLGEGENEVYQSEGVFTIDGSAAASVSVLLESTELLTDGQLIIGSEGEEDVLSFNSNDEVTDDALAFVSGIEILSLSGDANVTVGDNALAGIKSIIGGSGEFTVSQSAAGAITLDGSSSANVTAILETAEILADGQLILGGEGQEDKVILNSDAEITDDALAFLSGIEILSLTGAGNVTLGDNASGNGLLSIVGGEGGDLAVYQGAGALTLDGSAAGSVNVTLASAELLTDGQSIVGGEGEEDRLEIVSEAEITDEALALVNGVEILAVTGTSSVEIAGNGLENGLKSIVGGEGSELTVTQSAAGAMTIDGSAAASVTVVLETAEILAEGQLILGGEGEEDKISFNAGEVEITDEALAFFSGIEILSLAGTNSVTIGENGAANGLRSLVGGDGDLLVNQEAGALTIDGGASSSLNVTLASAELLAEGQSLIGSSGEEDRLEIASDAEITDEALALVNGVEILAVTGTSSVAIADNGLANGLKSIVGGEGSELTVTQSAAGPMTIDGSAAASVTAILETAEILADGQLILGGEGEEDKVIVNADAEITDEALAFVSGIEILSLSGANSVTIGDNGASNGLKTLIGGDGDLVVTQTGGALTIDGSASSSVAVTLENVGLLAEGQLILGGDGEEDKVFIGAAAEVSDDALAFLSGVEVLSLTGSNSVTIGENGSANGLKTLVGGEGDLLVNQEAGALFINGAASSSVNVTLASAELLTDGQSIVGGEGEEDRLEIASDAEITDEALALVNGVEILAVTGTSSVAIADNGLANGLKSIVGGEGSELTVTQSAAGAMTIDGSAAASVTAILETAEILADGQLILGGEGEEDKVIVNADAEITDEALAFVSGIEILSLSGANSVVIGDNGANNGLKTLIGGDGELAVSLNSGALTIDASASASVAITAATADIAASNAVTGGDGTDSLFITEEGSVADEVFASKTSLEYLFVSGASGVTLGANAVEMGLLGVSLGDGAASLTQTEDGSAPFAIDASAAESAYISIATSELVAGNVITGSGGTDTLTIVAEEEISDEIFENVTGIEHLILSGSSTLAIGDNIAANGLTTVTGGEGGFVLTQTAGLLTVDGSNSSSVSYTIQNSDLLADGESLIGSGGEGDVLTILEESEISDEQLALVNGVEILSLAATSTVSLDGSAAASGLLTVSGGEGIDLSVHQTSGAFTIDGSAAGSANYTLESAEFLADGQLFVGSEGEEDRLVLTAGGEISDEMLAFVRNVEILSLGDAANVTLSDNAAANGTKSVVGGEGIELVVNQSAGSLTIDGALASSVLVNLDKIDLLADGESIIGSTGTDTLAILNDAEIGEEMIPAFVSGIEILALAGASNKVTITEEAVATGLQSLIAGEGTELSLTLASGLMTVDGSTAGVVNVSLGSADLLAEGTSLIGGEGEEDVLSLTEATLSDTMLGFVSGIEILSLSGSSSVDFGSLAADAGIKSVVFIGEGDSTLNQTEGELQIDASASNSVLVNLTNGPLAAADTIIGSKSENADTLVVSSGDLEDEAFANISSFEALAIGGGASVILGANSATTGFSSVFGATGEMKLIQTADNTNAIFIDAASSSGARVEVDSAVIATNNSLMGGSGNDTLVIATEGEAGDDLLANSESVDVLVVAGSSKITLGENADRQLKTLVGGDSEMAVVQDAGTYLIDLSKSSSSSVTVSGGALFAGTTLSGGAGSDTVQISEAVTLADSVFAGKSSLDVLVLGSGGSATLAAQAAQSGITTIVALGETASLSVGAEITGTLSIDNSSLEGDGVASFVSLSSGTQAALTTLKGSYDNSTLAIGGAVIGDAAFQNISDIDVLLLDDATEIVLGENIAKIPKFHTIIGGSGGTTLTQGEEVLNAMLIDGTAAESNLYLFETAGQISNNTILGGTGSSTIGIANEDTLADENLARVSDVTSLTIAGGSVELASNADRAGIVSLLSEGSVSITASASSVNRAYDLDLGSGVTLAAGSGTADTLAVRAGTDVTDSAFAAISGVEDLLISGGSSATLGESLWSSGVRSVRAEGSNEITITSGGLSLVVTGEGAVINASAPATVEAAGSQGSYSLAGNTSLMGSGSRNLYLMSAADLATNVIEGGANDTIAIGEGQISDSALAGLSGVPFVNLNGSSALTLGGYADGTGILTVIGGTGSSTLTQDAFATNAYVLDVSEGEDNLLSVASAAQIQADTILGSGTDTLVVSAEDEVADGALANVTGVAALNLTGSSSVTLGGYADGTGILTVTGGAGSSTFTQNSFATNAYVLDGSAGSANVFAIASASQVAVNTVLGSGNDTLGIDTEDDVNDAVLANVTGVAALNLTGSSAVTLGGYADGTGIVTVTGGAGSSTFTQNSFATNAYVLDGSAGSANVFAIASADQVQSDTILGGAGRDTLSIGEDDISDAAFANVTSVPVLQLSGSSSVVLGRLADLAGITTVAGGAGSSTISQTEAFYSGAFLDGSAGSSNLFAVAGSVWLGGDTILGGAGNDTLQVTSADRLGDELFANVSDVEVLALTGSSDVTLGHAADLAGITRVIGGTGSSTITEGVDFYSAVVLDGSESSSNLFQVAGSVWLDDDTILGGEGVDTLSITAADSIEDDLFRNVSDVEVLALTGSSDITLGHAADLTGITRVIGGTGSSTITESAAFYSGVVLDGSNGTSNLFQVAGSVWLADDTILGGGGVDTLSITTGDALEDTLFANASGLEVLSLTGSSDLSLGANAQASGITSVIGGSGGTSVTATPSTSGSLSGNGNSFDGGSGSVGSTLLYSSPVTKGATFTSLTQYATGIVDQGWGGQGDYNGFAVVLMVNGQISYQTPWLGSNHSAQDLSYSLSPTDLANLNAAVSAVNWNSNPEVQIGMYANAVQWPGWHLHANSTGFEAQFTVKGYDSNLYLDGSASTVANVFTASSGNDTLIAGTAADTLTGGAGSDLFVLGSGTVNNPVSITDFTVGTDALQLANFGAGGSGYSVTVAGAGEAQLFRADTLIANISFSGSADDLLTNARFI